MGLMKQIKEQRVIPTKKSVQNGKKWPNSLTFHPTTSEKEMLRNSITDSEKDLELLATFMDRGCSLSLGVRVDSGSYFATLREKSSDWMSAISLSAWHSTPSGALKGLSFALRTRYDSFPEITLEGNGFVDEW